MTFKNQPQATKASTKSQATKAFVKTRAVSNVSMDVNDVTSAMSLPEPNAWKDATTHPLWATLSHQCMSLPFEVQDAYLLSDVLGCKSSCMILCSHRGRLLCQCHRCGYQLFGGGKKPMPLVWRLHQLRREQWMESNLDVASNPAVMSLSNPILIMQSEWESCLVQICIIDDRQIAVSSEGVVTVGGCHLWSREKARDVSWWSEKPFYECEVAPSPAHIHAGQFYLDQPVMNVCSLSDVWQTPHLWRSCDWVTLAMLRKRLEDVLAHCDSMVALRTKSEAYLAECIFFGDVSVERQRHCEKLMSYWFRMGDICQTRWPLLTTSVLYQKWIDKHWRTSTFYDACTA